MMAQVDINDFKAIRSHSQYKLESIDFDDFQYNLNKTIFNFQKAQERKTIDKMSKFRRVKSFLKIDNHENANSIYQTFSRNAPGFDETETKELLELILQLEYFFILYHKFYPEQSNPILLSTYLNCLNQNKEKFFDNYSHEVSEILQMSILRNSQQRIIDEKTDDNIVKFLVNEVNRRNKYKKNLQLVRSDQNKIQKLIQNYELQRRNKQLEQTKSNILVASMKVVLLNEENQPVIVRFPLIDKKKALCLDMEKLLKQGDVHDLFKQWTNYIDITSSHSEIILLISILQDLFQEQSWIIKQMLDQLSQESIFSVESITIQIGSMNQVCQECLNVLDRSHKEIAVLIQQKLQNFIPQIKIKENLRIQKSIMIMQNSEEELQKENQRNCLENCLLQLNNLKMCLIPQGLLSQLFFIHRYCDDGIENEEDEVQEQKVQKDYIEQKEDKQSPLRFEQNQQFAQRNSHRHSSRRTSLMSFGYSEMEAEHTNFQPLQQKLTDMKFNSTIYMDNVDRKEWKKIFDSIKKEKKNNIDIEDVKSTSSSSSFKVNCSEDKCMKQMKNFLQTQQNRMQ